MNTVSINEYQQQFEEAYKKLNTNQKVAVDTIEGPVMVIAGPGTGKTQVLTLRIANILLKTDTKPEQILALTFTKSGAATMRNRLRKLIGPAAYRVPIYTFHSFCELIIREYPEHFTRIIGSKIVSDIEQVEILETILEDPEVTLLRPVNAPEYYHKAIMANIGSLKQEGISPHELQKLIDLEREQLQGIEQYHTKGPHKGKERGEYTKQVEKIHKQQALLFVYRQYQALLAQRRRYDYHDMILETVSVLEHIESVRLDLQETYLYVMADEHQDVNGAQNNLLSLLTSYHDQPNLFVVGDEKQAIYRFQGASLENFLYFENQFPQTKLISLTENYRSTQTILDVAHELVKVSDGPLVDYRIPLIAKSDIEHSPVTVAEFPHELHEHAYVYDCITQSLEQGMLPEEIAVIVRSNREVEQLTYFLRGRDIAVNPSADGDILDNPIFLSLYELLTVVAIPSNETVLAAVLQAPYSGIGAADMVTILRQVSYKQSLTTCLFSHLSTFEHLLLEPEKVKEFATRLETLRKSRLTDAPHRVVSDCVTVMNFLDFFSAQTPQEVVRVVRRFYDEVEVLVASREVTTLVSLVQFLERRITHRIPLLAPYIADNTSAVAVMTAHKAKGLEFAVVCIPHVTDSTWSGKKIRDSFKLPLLKTVQLELESNEDERRLLYVALTRAKKYLYLSYSKVNSDGKENTLSPFVSQLENLVPLVAGSVKNETVATFYQQTKPSLLHVQALLKKHLEERGLSVTALNNLIKNPWLYFFRNVIRVPAIQTPALQFGTAMHSVMEYLTKTHTKTSQLPTFTQAREYLERTLERLPLSTTEFTALFEKGLDCIPSHLDLLASTLPQKTIEELSLRVIVSHAHPDLPELILHGKLDRLDFDGDRVLRVVDYKTGKPKTRKALEGKNKDADTSYLRQLAFYALLLRLYEQEKFATEQGTLLFLQPDSKGVIREETFVSDGAIQDQLLEEIQEAITTLLTGAFVWDDELLVASEYERLGVWWREKFIV